MRVLCSCKNFALHFKKETGLVVNSTSPPVTSSTWCTVNKLFTYHRATEWITWLNFFEA